MWPYSPLAAGRSAGWRYRGRTAAPPPADPWALTFSDPFTAPDTTLVSSRSGWQAGTGSPLVIKSNLVGKDSGSATMNAVLRSAYNATQQRVVADFNSNANIGLLVLASGGALDGSDLRGYFLSGNGLAPGNGFQLRLRKIEAGGFTTTLGTTTDYPSTALSRLACELRVDLSGGNPVFTVWNAGAQRTLTGGVMSVTDSSSPFTSGRPGLAVTIIGPISGTTGIDNYQDNGG